jgi:hypothetical protein
MLFHTYATSLRLKAYSFMRSTSSALFLVLSVEQKMVKEGIRKMVTWYFMPWKGKEL